MTEKASPVLITATVNGNGDVALAAKATFDLKSKINGPADIAERYCIYRMVIALRLGTIPWLGDGYDKTSLLRNMFTNTTPDGYWGGIWMSSGGPSADESGNIYLAAGNGSVKNGNAADVTKPL